MKIVIEIEATPMQGDYEEPIYSSDPSKAYPGSAEPDYLEDISVSVVSGISNTKLVGEIESQIESIIEDLNEDIATHYIEGEK